uniref:Putative complex iii assembly factor lyrm7-like protein n=1 Tax=Tabanus bromius TaxID=304241 RepID=A0A0K8TPC6_TABBR
MSQLRTEVLKQFRNLHKARKVVFAGDVAALEKARLEINKHFKQNKHVNEETTTELLKFAGEVETELRTNVIQAVEEKPGVYRVRIMESTTLLDNVEFDENANILTGPKDCCSKKK